MENVTIDKNEFYKMCFIMNALNDDWKIKKNDSSYIFTKKHENKKEVYEEKYLEEFIRKNGKVFKI